MGSDPIRHLLVTPIFPEISREGEYFTHKDLLHAL